MPGMDDVPSSTFTNLSVLFSKLGISDSEADGAGDEEEMAWRTADREQVKEALKTPPKSPPTTRPWREAVPTVGGCGGVCVCVCDYGDLLV